MAWGDIQVASPKAGSPVHILHQLEARGRCLPCSPPASSPVEMLAVRTATEAAVSADRGGLQMMLSARPQ